jgi:thioredoxin 1
MQAIFRFDLRYFFLTFQAQKLKGEKMTHPLILTDATFDLEVLQSDQPVLVDFWAEWCGPCKMIAPAIAELAGEYNGKAKVGKLDVDNNNESAIKFGIRSIPALLIFKGGIKVDEIIGAVPKQVIKQRLEAVLK